MKAIIPSPPEGPYPIRYGPLPDHTRLPEKEGESPTRYRNAPAPDHTQLPDKDGAFVRTSLEPLQSHLLTDSLWPVLRRLDPQGNYFIGEDCGIYWRLTDPPERGAKAPDWFCVLGVPALLDEQMRRSYVMWQEIIAPLLVLEYVSGDGTEERDPTPYEGKFWVYENAIRPSFYGIFEPNQGRVEVYHLLDGRFQLMAANERGRVAIPPLGVELGIWQGQFGNYELSWLRWWNGQGNLLLTGDERADRLAARLRDLGIDPEQAGSSPRG
jgi:Uma2 family endonuclease